MTILVLPPRVVMSQARQETIALHPTHHQKKYKGDDDSNNDSWLPTSETKPKGCGGGCGGARLFIRRMHSYHSSSAINPSSSGG